MDFLHRLQSRIVIFDGAMGTMLQKAGLKPGQCAEYWNLLYPDIVSAIHKAYLKAGADVIQTNTYGANKVKLERFGLEKKIGDIVGSAVKNAQKITKERGLVALSVGPIGKSLEPFGDLNFDEIYEIFEQLIALGAKNGVDMISIESMDDIQEAKAALLAAKNNTNLPIICQMTFSADGRTNTGTDFLTTIAILESLGANVIGANCCTIDPEQLVSILDPSEGLISTPIIMQPKIDNQSSIKQLTPDQFAYLGQQLVDSGVNIIGGCCGTTPQHIEKLANLLHDRHPKIIRRNSHTKIASRTKTFIADRAWPTVIVGGRINPYIQKVIVEELKQGRTTFIEKEGERQVLSGAHIIDVNISTATINQEVALKKSIKSLQQIIDSPLCINNKDSKIIEEGLKSYVGKPLIKAVTGEDKSLTSIIPLAKKYGAALMALTFDERGIPNKAVDKIKIAEKIIKRAQDFNFPIHDLIFDCLPVSLKNDPQSAIETLKAIRFITEEFRLNTSLDINRISNGLPDYSRLDHSFLLMALSMGLTMPTINSLDPYIVQSIITSDFILGRISNIG